MSQPQPDLISIEVVGKIRSDGRALLVATETIRASLETGCFDEAGAMAAELAQILRKHLLLVDGVLDAVCPDDPNHRLGRHDLRRPTRSGDTEWSSY
jgi:hypothetical protein